MGMTKAQREEALRQHITNKRLVVERVASQKRDDITADWSRALRAAMKELNLSTDLAKAEESLDNILYWLLGIGRNNGNASSNGNGRYPAKKTADVGLYRMNGKVYLVQDSQRNPGHHYALEMLSGGKLDIARGVVFDLKPAHKMSATEIAQLKKQHPDVVRQYDRVMKAAAPAI